MENKKILIVDDDADMTLATRLILESAGYDVEEAIRIRTGETGPQAL